MSHRSAVPLRRERMRESLLTERSHREGSAGGQLRFLVALLLFLFFFAWDDSGNTVCGVTPAKMIDMIEDNRYDTILQECDAVLAELLHTE